MTTSPQLRESPETANFQFPACCETAGRAASIRSATARKIQRRMLPPSGGEAARDLPQDGIETGRMLSDGRAAHNSGSLFASGRIQELFVGECRPLQNHRCFLKTQPRIAWVELVWVSIAQVAEKIGLPLAVRKEFRIQFACVDPGHGSAIQSQSARGEDEVCALQGTVAEGGLVNQGFVPDKVGAHVSLRKEPGKILVEFDVPSDDDRGWGSHGFVDVPGGQGRAEARFRRRSG